MKVILKETIATLGIIGTEVNVSDGYARNYLFPQGKAILATTENHKLVEQTKAKFELQIAKEKTLAKEMAKKVEGIACKISAKVSGGNKLYGSITTHDIIDALNNQDIKLERRMLMLVSPIKTLGTYKIPVHLYKDVEPEITVEVIAETKKDN